MILSDEDILAEAIRLVKSGVSVIFPVNGRSMIPFVIGGRESLILSKPDCKQVGTDMEYVGLQVGHIVLVDLGDNRYVIHRIEKIVGDSLTLMGDGNLCQREHCRKSDVKAVATHVVDAAGRRHPLYNPMRRFASRLWMLLLPVRKYLLKIYAIIH